MPHTPKSSLNKAAAEADARDAAAKAKEQAAADAEKARQAQAAKDAALEEAEKQRIADETKAAKERANAEKRNPKVAKAAAVVPPTPEDPAVAKFREQFFGVEVEGQLVRPEWKPLNWVGGKETDTCVITSSYGTLADDGGAVLTFPRPVAEKLAAELRQARPIDRITVSTK